MERKSPVQMELMHKVWKEEPAPNDWNESLISSIFKSKIA